MGFDKRFATRATCSAPRGTRATVEDLHRELTNYSLEWWSSLMRVLQVGFFNKAPGE